MSLTNAIYSNGVRGTEYRAKNIAATTQKSRKSETTDSKAEDTGGVTEFSENPCKEMGLSDDVTDRITGTYKAQMQVWKMCGNRNRRR